MSLLPRMVEKIRSSSDMHNLVGRLPIGQTIDLTFYRQGREHKLTAEIQPIDVATIDGGELHEKLAGAQIGEMRESKLQQGPIEYLQVREVLPGSNAWQAGILAGDVLYSINKQLIRNFGEAFQVVKDNQHGLILTIHRGTRELFLLIK